MGNYPDAWKTNRAILEWSNSPSGRFILYRGWRIDSAYVGYSAIHPDYDASWEGEEDGYIDNGLQVHAMTIDGVKAEVDAKIEEMES